MKDELKQAAEAIATHPKTSSVIAASPLYVWINNLNPILDFVATVMGIGLVAILMMYHWQNMKKIKRENDKG